MAEILIRNVDPNVLDWLKSEAAAGGRSVSEQAKIVLIHELKVRKTAREFEERHSQPADSHD